MIELLHTDCLEYMATLPDKAFDLAIVDPPYGIGMDGGKVGKAEYAAKAWDTKIPPPEYFTELMRVSKNQIIWGGNFMAHILTPSRCWLVWDKNPNCVDMTFGDCELAWTSFDRIIKKFRFLWSGAFQGNMHNKETRIHPTQKPAQLYKWLLKNYATPDMKIIDTHLGSGSSAIAAYDFGCDFVGMEIDKDYYDAAVKRFETHKMQAVLQFA